MRSNKEMMDLILNTADYDERVRAVIMNGSRANPGAKKDIFQDYDIVYIVKNISSFTSDHSWIDIFGERMIMQIPQNDENSFSYLMQFKDGNRLDLTLVPVKKADQLIKDDSLSILLLDKDDIIGSLPPPDDRDYHINKPALEEYQHTCNEFWWICTYIAKGLWRKELPYVNYMYEQINRSMLHKMINWYIGIRTNFTVNTGKCNKYFKDYLEQDKWEKYVATYSKADYGKIWQSFFTMVDLFRDVALKVAKHFNFDYPREDDENVTAHLHHIYNLPADAKEIY